MVPNLVIAPDYTVMGTLNEELLGDDPTLAEMVRRFVDAFQPERTYLLGSQAREEAVPR